jgi:serine/threonine protein kinase
MPIPYNPGDTVRGYRIVQKLSEGNYATAYEAVQPGNGRRVFLKQYGDPTELLGDIFHKFVLHQQDLKRLLDQIPEAETIYETFEENGIHHQTKEFMLGRDLRSYFSEKKALPLEERRLIAAVSLYSLLQAHKKGIIHNDLKPEQIFLQEDRSIKMKYRVKLTDFDFSTIENQHQPVYKVTTPFYSSPEYLRGEDTTKASDAFTMGIVLYEVLTGDVPYQGMDPDEYKTQVLGYQARRPKEINPAIPDDLDQQLFALLDPNQLNRPPLQAIHKLLLQPFPSASVAQPAPPEAPPRIKIPKRIELVSEQSSIVISVHKSVVIGRDNCRHLPAYQLIANEQFELVKTAEAWVVKGRQCVNKTFLNGEDITEKEKPINNGDEIFIGNYTTRNGVTLKVRFVEE